MKKVFLIIIIFSLISGKISAQDFPNNTVIITIQTARDLPQAQRDFDKIPLELPKTPPAPVVYKTEDVEMSLPSITTKIKIPGMPKDSLKALYGNYVKAGFGNYTTPYFEGFFNNKRSESVAYGAHVKHYSSKNGPVKNQFSGTSENAVDLYGRYFAGPVTLKGNLNYRRYGFNYYGIRPDSLEQRDKQDSLKVIYNIVSGGVSAENSDAKAALNYKLGLNYYNIFNNFDTHESEYLAGLTSYYKIDEQKGIQVNTTFSYSTRKADTLLNNNRIFFILKPAFKLNSDKYRIRAGLNIAYTNDQNAMDNFHVYPDVYGEYNLNPNMSVYGGIEGELQKNTYRSFVTENPWLYRFSSLNNTNKPLELYGGVRGKANGKINYNARLAYANYKYLYFFNNSASDTSKFEVLYDTATTSVLNIRGEASYDVVERIRLGIKADYFNYNVSTLAQPWHRPKEVISIFGVYNVYKKIFFNSELYYLGGLKGYNPVSDKAVNLPSIVDLNLKVDYRFSGVFSAYLEFNNILSKKYQRYLYYPVKGINILGGITYSF